MTSSAETLFKLAYEISPIVLTGGGIVGDLPGGALPIVAFTETINFVQGILGGGEPTSLDNFFAHFSVIPGGTLIDDAVATYPFANQSVAANAIIVQPLRVSLLMQSPAKGSGAYVTKIATFTAIQNVLAQHVLLGGTFTVVTPAYIYENCLLTSMRDVSGGDTKQVQVKWQLDFLQPLVTQAQAQQAQNMLMSRMSAGGAVTPDESGEIQWSGPAAGVGNAGSGLSPSLYPAAQPQLGTSIGSNVPPAGTQ